jgi:cytochrome c-type biogenesis protein CcmH/NrfG
MIKMILFAALLFSPALAAAEPPPHHHHQEIPRTPDQLKKEAASLLEQIKASPSDPELYVKLGFTYTRLDQADDAQQAFENAAKFDPKEVIAHYMLGLIYEKKGMKDKALVSWKACLDNANDPSMRETAKRHIHHLSRP